MSADNVIYVAPDKAGTEGGAMKMAKAQRRITTVSGWAVISEDHDWPWAGNGYEWQALIFRSKEHARGYCGRTGTRPRRIIRVTIQQIRETP